MSSSAANVTPPVRASSSVIVQANHDRFVAQSLESYQASPSETDACIVEVRSLQHPSRAAHHVLMSVGRPWFYTDADAMRSGVRVVRGGHTFCVQQGTLSPPTKEWCMKAVACTCNDWKYRGTEHTATEDELAYSLTTGLSEQSVRHKEQHQHVGRFFGPKGVVMGAIRGCKHMICANGMQDMT